MHVCVCVYACHNKVRLIAKSLFDFSLAFGSDADSSTEHVTVTVTVPVTVIVTVLRGVD